MAGLTDLTGGLSMLDGVVSVDGISGKVTLVAGSNITITDNSPTAGNITIASSGGGGGSPAGSTGDVQFNSSGSFGADTGNFFWDATNHRLGIGTVSPNYPLEVAGTGGATSGIMANFTSSNTSQTIFRLANSTVTNSAWQFGLGGSANAFPDGFYFYQESVGYPSGYRFSVNSVGNVGIGTVLNSPSARLHLISTTEQQRIGYDTSNYYKTTVGSTGGVTFDAVGSGAGFTFSDPMNVSNYATLNSASGGGTLLLYGLTTGSTSGSFYFDGPDANNAAYGTFGIAVTGTYFGTTGGVIFASSKNGTGTQLPMKFGGYNGSWVDWMTISTAGNVGINTTSPGKKLEVLSTSEQLRLRYDGSNYADFFADSSGVLNLNPSGSSVISNATKYFFIFNSGGTEITAGVDSGVNAYGRLIFGRSGGGQFSGDTAGDGFIKIYSSDLSKKLHIGAGNPGGAPTMTLDGSRNVGIGNTSPSYKLDVAGDANISSGNYYRYNGVPMVYAQTSLNNYYYAFAGNLSATGTNNLGFGYIALANITSGNDNIAIGFESLYSNTTGSYNSALGAYSMASNTSGNYNMAVGASSLSSNTTGGSNIAVGYRALELNTTGGDNVANGTAALSRNTTGAGNVALGSNALQANTTGSSNVSLGGGLYNNTTGSDNFGIGAYALFSNTTGNFNIGIGVNACIYTTGDDNIAFGTNCLYSNTSGTNNIGVGFQALFDETTGTCNIGIGYNTGRGITTGSYNTIIGAQVTGLSSSLSNTVIIADGQGNQRIYVDSSGNVGIGTTSPSYPLHVVNSAGNNLMLESSNVYGVGFNLNSTYTGGHWYQIFSTANSNPIGGGAFLIYDATSNASRLTINSSGNVGIGNTSPSYKLDVTGDINTSTGYRAGGTAGLSVTITTAKLTPVTGTNGSMTFVGGILTAQTQAT